MPEPSTESQATLGAFDTTERESPEESETEEPTVARDPSTGTTGTPSKSGGDSSDTSTETEENQNGEEEISQRDLPPVTVWDTDNPVEIDGATVLNPRVGDFQSLPGTTGISKHKVMYVIDGVSEYREVNDCREIDAPTYYSECPDFEPVVTKRSAGSKGGARGITGPFLEKVIRYIAGKGGFSSTELSVFVGAHDHFLLTYQGDSFLILTEDLSYPADATYSPSVTTIHGIDIPEDDTRIVDGIGPFIEAVEQHHGLTVTGHHELKGSSHRFTVADPDIDYIQIKGHHLHRIARSTTDPHDLIGEFTYKSDFDEVYTGEITSSDLPYTFGEEVRNGHAIGFTKSVSDPRTSSRASLSNRVKVSVNTYYLLKREKSDRGYIRFEVRDTAERVAEFKPENKEYDPINDPLS